MSDLTLQKRRHLIALVLAVLVAASIPFVANAENSASELVWSGSATSLATLKLHAGNGSLNVKAVPGDSVRIRVEMSAKRWTDDEPWRKITSWFSSSGNKSAEELMASVRLHTNIKGDRQEISLRPSGRDRTSKIFEKWTLELPATMALEAKMDAAEIDITGLAGGVTLRLGYGSAQLDVAGGDLDLQVTTGDLNVNTSGDYGDIRVKSTVGDTDLWVHGLKMEYTDPPGPGSKVSLHGEGENRVRVEVEVGDAELHIE